jgi:hypothetical protein
LEQKETEMDVALGLTLALRTDVDIMMVTPVTKGRDTEIELSQT